MKSSLSEVLLPKVWCDFNACGWSGAPDDTCYYAFDQKALAALSPAEGMRLFAYDDDNTDEVIGCEARLERFNASWRIRPDHTPYRLTRRCSRPPGPGGLVLNSAVDSGPGGG